ncbi:YdcF family protein [Amycolatopsis sp. NPDC058986]|uniref:YdcF family protein n=1 Tax=unclassified Amycolatopsis TaxID=2618356 RepID=UPI00366DDF26
MRIAYVIFGIAAVWFLFFLISFLKERRRLRNGVYLFMTLFFAALGTVASLASVSAQAAEIVVVSGFLLIPLAILALAIFLVFNGVTMIRREGRRLANLLSLLLGAGILAYLPFTAAINRIPWTPAKVAVTVLTLILAYVSFLFVCFLLYAIVYGRIRQRRAVDFVVVLGSGLIGAKVPPLLASRLDRARAVFEAGVARGGQPLLVTSGGQGPDEDVPESHAMADYLVERGVPRERILLEDRSKTTWENLTFSREIMTGLRPGYRCVVVTNNFHVLRAALTARRAKVDGQVIGAPTAWYFWPSATIREFVAVFLDHKVVNFGICLSLAAITVLGALG